MKKAIHYLKNLIKNESKLSEQCDEIVFSILPTNICNLSKIPTKIEDNFLVKFADIIKDNSYSIDSIVLKNIIERNYDFRRLESLSNFYQINSNTLKAFSAGQVFLPWTHYKPADFKDSFFKIFTDSEYQNKQCIQMNELVKSIQLNGYKPENYSQMSKGRSHKITGYFLSKNNIRKFYVVSGNHRIAALASLEPNKEINVSIRSLVNCKDRDIENTNLIRSSNMKTEYKWEDAENWPSVKSNFISLQEARDIFDQYYK